MPSLSPQENEQLQATSRLHAPLARAASLGRKNGRSILIFGLLTLLVSAFDPDPLSLAIGAVVTVTGFIEQKLAPRLAQADEAVPSQLARNELVLMAGIVIYGLLKLTVLRPDSEALAQQVGDTSGLGLDVAQLADSLNTLVYVTVIAVALLYQGGMAKYFARRGAMIARYRSESPEWARQIVEGLVG